MGSLLGLLGLAAFVALLIGVAWLTGKITDPAIDRADRWITKRYSRPRDERPGQP